MLSKGIAIRLAAEGGKQLKAELKSVGTTGQRSMKGISREARIATARLHKFAMGVKIAGRIVGVAMVAGLTAMVKHSLDTIDAQAKLAASMGTTTASMQVLTRAAELAGVSQGEVQQATIMMTKSLSQAARGTGPAVQALQALHLSASDLSKLTIDKKMSAIQDAIAKFIPTAEQAAVASQIFGSRAGLIFTRIDSATLRQATQDVQDFGVAVSEQDAAKIQTTNDALSRMGLMWTGIANRLSIAVAPALKTFADWMAKIGKTTGPLGVALKGFANHIGEIASIAATFAAVIGGRLIIKLGAMALGIRKASTALLVLRGAMIRTGFGALIVGAGELFYWFGNLVSGAGGFGAAMGLMGAVSLEVWDRIKLGGKSLASSLESVWLTVKSGWLTMLETIQGKWSSFLISMGHGFDGMSIIPGMEEIGTIIGAAGIDAGSARIELTMAADEAKSAANNAALAAVQMANDSVAPLKSMATLATAVANITNATARTLSTPPPNIPTTPHTGGGGKAPPPPVPVAAKTAWEAARNAVNDYAKTAKDAATKISDVVKSAFANAENAIGNFVKTGKLDFSSLVSSMLADIAKLAARKYILGPLAAGLDNVLGGIAAPVHHAGGIAGGAAPMRQIPAMALAGAQRYHNGGYPGLRPDEIPAILQRGERVLSRRETAQYGQGGQNITINIQTRDAESFRQSRAQISADIARAVSAGQRGM